MISFGSKSITLLSIFLVLLVTLFISETSQVENLRELEPLAAFAVGVMAILVGGIFFRAIRPRSPSAYRFSIHLKRRPKEEVVLFYLHKLAFSVARNDHDKIVETPHSIQRTLVFCCFLMMGLLVFNQREISLLEKFPAQLTLGKTQYCEDQDDNMQKAEDRPECQLVLRAFRLGYATELGDCGNVETGPPKLCTRRQKDEPYLHYAGRLLANSYQITFGQFSDDQALEKYSKRWEQDLDRLESMTKTKVAEVTGQPRSSHFVISNLPAPENPTWAWLRDTFQPSRCINDYSLLANKIPDPQNGPGLSQTFLLAAGHLLFDPKYRQTITNCKEYQFLWDTPVDNCHQLSKNPQPTLQALGIYRSIHTLLQRYKHKALSHPQATLPRSDQVVSISCFNYKATNKSFIRKNIEVDGYQISLKIFSYPTLEYKTGDSIEVFKIVSSLASKRFHYGKLLSKASLSTDSAIEVTEELLNDEDFRMTRLAFLEDLDVFLAPSWIMNRDDLLQVYPYYLHLSHFVDSFRLNYSQSRGRL